MLVLTFGCFLVLSAQEKKDETKGKGREKSAQKEAPRRQAAQPQAEPAHQAPPAATQQPADLQHAQSISPPSLATPGQPPRRATRVMFE